MTLVLQVCQYMLDNCGTGIQCLQSAPSLSRASFCNSLLPPSCMGYAMTPPLPVTRVPQTGTHGEHYQIQCLRNFPQPGLDVFDTTDLLGPIDSVPAVYHDIVCELMPGYGGTDCFYHCYTRQNKGPRGKGLRPLPFEPHPVLLIFVSFLYRIDAECVPRTGQRVAGPKQHRTGQVCVLDALGLVRRRLSRTQRAQ